MAKFAGEIGFAIQRLRSEDDDVWVEETVERRYRGDILRNSRRWENGSGINDNVVLNNQISIIADGFFLENYGCVRYAVMGGVKWKVTNVDVQRPRLILTLGEGYNG